MARFFPALASSDMLGYLDENRERHLMSIRGLMPPSMSRRFLTSLSFDEEIHYRLSSGDGDPESRAAPNAAPIEEVFVDCGAFHYSKMDVPRFKMGGFVNAITSFEQYQERHISRDEGCTYLLCSPDHIIPPGCDDATARARTGFTLNHAERFIDLAGDEKGVTPVGVVHGRSGEERSEMTRELLDLGFDYLAFGGLVPLSRKPKEVMSQIMGNDGSEEPSITRESALGIAKENGAKTHLFGLNSPDWYRWAKRLGVDSFDGSKLSTEGAVNGIVWVEKDAGELGVEPSSAAELYSRMKVKDISIRQMAPGDPLGHLEVSEDGRIDPGNPAWEYLLSSTCTSPKCPHSPSPHNCDPRVTGSIEHNMGRTALNSWAFDSIMTRIDEICERAVGSKDEVLMRHWSPIEVAE